MLLNFISSSLQRNWGKSEDQTPNTLYLSVIAVIYKMIYGRHAVLLRSKYECVIWGAISFFDNVNNVPSGMESQVQNPIVAVTYITIDVDGQVKR